MSIAQELSRIQTDRNKIRTKLVDLGLATSTDNLTTLANAVNSIEKQGAVQLEVTEGKTISIPAGYHDGSGTVTGRSDSAGDAEKYKLQQKVGITPTKSQLSVTPDSGFYGMSSVTIDPIPEAYQNVSSVTATASDVLANKVIVTSDGTVTAGTMPNNGSVDQTLSAGESYTIPAGYHDGTGAVNATALGPQTAATASADKILKGETAWVGGVKVTGTMPIALSGVTTLNGGIPEWTIPKGYHDGQGKVNIIPEEKSVTPTKSEQTVTPTIGKVFTSVTVEKIPDAYQDVSGVTATADKVLVGSKFVTADGTPTDGSMPNNGAISKKIDGLTNASATIPKGYTSGGTVTLTGDIEEALAAI